MPNEPLRRFNPIEKSDQMETPSHDGPGVGGERSEGADAGRSQGQS